MKNILLILILGIMLTITACNPSATESHVTSPSYLAFDGSVNEDEVPPCSRGRRA